MMVKIIPEPNPVPTGPDEGPPERLTASHIAEDLSLSNNEGTSWFEYLFEPSDGENYPDLLIVRMYDEEGKIAKKFVVTMKIEEMPL